MDSSNMRPQLPPVGLLDIEKSRREEEAYQSRFTGAPSQSLPAAALPSPTYQYPSGPPPPYSHPAPQHRIDSVPGAQSAAPTPPDSRQLHDEKEAIKQTVRQSLPSISEALGVDNQSTYHTAAAQPTPTSAHDPSLRSVGNSSPSPTRRSYAMEPPQHPSEHHASANSQYPPYRRDGYAQYPPIETSRPSYADPRPPLHVQTAQSPRREYPPPATQPSPVYEQPTAPPSSMAPPASFPYGYTPYPPRYAQPTPAASNTGPIYQPSLSNAAPPTPTPTWKSESPSTRYGGSDERVYGESVKRHLDMYDIEAALGEISQTSSIMTDFSRRYGDRMHQTARSGPTLATLPSIIEVEDMMNKSKLQLEALSKIREVVIAQQVAYDQQAAEQQQQQRQKAYAEPAPAAIHADYEDSKVGFAGSDLKKRRGRAAPPGRCHSCNRAETPEWRRGPDGARTLCNACGLHYAKLTRKQNNANKGANGPGGSNLRPKENMA